MSALVPLASVLLGGALTYWLNVRARRRSRVEDLFNEAIAAVAVADASKSYLRQVAKPAVLSDGEYQSLLSSIARSAVEVHIQRAAEAREVVAKVIQYEPKVRPFYADAEAITSSADEIITVLTKHGSGTREADARPLTRRSSVASLSRSDGVRMPLESINRSQSGRR